MIARDAVTGLLTAYLVSVPTLAWLAAVGGLLWVLGAVWGPVLTGAMTWLQLWGTDLAGAIFGVAYVLAGTVCVALMLMPVIKHHLRRGA